MAGAAEAVTAELAPAAAARPELVPAAAVALRPELVAPAVVLAGCPAALEPEEPVAVPDTPLPVLVACPASPVAAA